MHRKDVLLQGVRAGATLATTFWLSEILSGMWMGVLSFVKYHQSVSVDFGDIVRSFLVYVLFCVTVGALLSGARKDLSFVYAGLLVVGVGLFEWASWGEGALRVLVGSPWVRREIWTTVLIFFGFLWWVYLRKKTTEQIQEESFSIFLILSFFLLIGQYLSMEYRSIPFLRDAFRFEEMSKPLLVYILLCGLAVMSLLSFFWVKKRISPFMKIQRLHRIIFSICLLVSALAYLPRLLPVAFPKRPNIILIVLDTVRADRLSSYGYSRNTSPHFDQLAKEGALFEEAKSTSHWTLPSHASLFTGLFPSRHGAGGASSGGLTIRGTYRTLAEHLRDEGYRTVGVAANRCVGGSSGLERGFDQFLEVWQYNRRSLATRVQTRFITSKSPFGAPSVNLLLHRVLLLLHCHTLSARYLSAATAT